MISIGHMNRLITMTVTEWERHERQLLKAEQAAYADYKGVFPCWPVRPGCPQMAGLGGLIGGFTGQAEWLTARKALAIARRVRIDPNAWQRVEHPDPTVTAFLYRFADDLPTHRVRGRVGHTVEIVTHGVEVSDCRTPTEAIMKIQEAHRGIR